MNTQIKGLFTLLAALASAANADSIELSSGLMRFDRTEFTSSGARLNRESGFMPGMTASLNRSTPGSEHALTAELWGGTVPYDGQLQNGTPLSTNTSQLLYSIGYQFLSEPKHKTASLFLRIGWHRWHRDIQPTNISGRLFERYTWFSMEPGVRFILPGQRDGKWLLELSAIAIRGGKVIVDLNSSSFGKPEVDIGNGNGFRLGIGHEFHLGESRSLFVNLDYQRTRFDRGLPTAASNGSTIAVITEPESLDQTASFEVKYRIPF